MEYDKNRIAVISLLMSCFSLLLAIMPSCIIDQKIREIETSYHVHSAPVSLEIKGVRQHFSQQDNSDRMNALPELTEEEVRIKKLRRLSVFFTTAMVLSAVTAIGTAVYSWSKEHGREICIGSIITAAVALSWQYIGAGISAGVAVFVFIMLVASFS